MPASAIASDEQPNIKDHNGASNRQVHTVTEPELSIGALQQNTRAYSPFQMKEIMQPQTVMIR